MAKSPKTTSFTSSPDTTSGIARLSPDEFASGRAPTRGSDASLPTINPPSETVAPLVLQGGNDHPPSVEVSNMPDTVAALLETHLKAITWPTEQLHLLTALGTDTGLFSSAQGNTYAHIAGEGYFQVEYQSDGRYRIFWPAALGEPGPLLTQVEGQPHWRSLAPSRPEQRASAGNESAVDVATDMSALPPPLPETQARWLTKVQDATDGIRYDQRGQMYVDMEDGTTFQVRKRPDGGYQLASHRQRNLLAISVEQISGSHLWRIEPPQPTRLPDTPQRQHPTVEPDEPTPGTSKRARLEEDSHTLPSHPLPQDQVQSQSIATGPLIGEWVHWGQASKPQWSDSIEIDGLHYVIVPQHVTADTKLVFLENPLFRPGRFEAFEHMLANTPALQPKWAVKVADKWTVLENRTFDRPLSQHVARSFKLLADQTSSNIAEAVFNRANDSMVINGDGLRVLFDTLYHWENRSTSHAATRDLADPLMLLPTLPTQLNADFLGRSLALPAPVDWELKRIDFDTRLFNRNWTATLNTPGTSLRKVFADILEYTGYDVDRTSRLLSEDTLLFKREGLDAVFMLRFRPVNPDGTLHRQWDPDSELTAPALRTLIARSRWKQLLEPEKVIFLLGGMQTFSAEHTLLFIVREG